MASRNKEKRETIKSKKSKCTKITYYCAHCGNVRTNLSPITREMLRDIVPSCDVCDFPMREEIDN